jgi:polyphosphate glucokinase
VSVIIGVDIGGTSIKVAPVDTASGALVSEPHHALTPCPATPSAVVATIADLVTALGASEVIGVGFPGVVRRGVVGTAANLDPSWVGLDAAATMSSAIGGRPVTVVNDADAAGLAEVGIGSAVGQRGVVVVVTLGTGIGTAVFHDGVLLPNTELGHLLLDGVDAETLASGRARNEQGVTWELWTGDLSRFLGHIETLLWPDLFVIGGGISAKFSIFGAHLDLATPVVAAQLRNEAGIVGAALGAARVTRDVP